MNCEALMGLLDDGAFERLDARRKAEAEAHAAACADCAAALAAYRALLADEIPRMPASIDAAALVARLGAASADGMRRAVVRWRRPAIIAAFALVGGAVAGIALRDEGPSSEPAVKDVPRAEEPAAVAQPSADPSSPTAASSPTAYLDAAEAAAADDFRASLMSSALLPDGEMYSLLKMPPEYPSAALRACLEGHAIVEFTVSAKGDVADPRIVESSDSVFEASTLDAVRKSKYKPRIVGGRPVAAGGIRNRFAYRLDDEPCPPVAASDNFADNAAAPADIDPAPSSPEWRLTLLPAALECLESADLRCVELNLDEIRSTYELRAREEAELSRIYGFVHYRRGDYERAVAAYEKAARLGAPEGGVSDDYFVGMSLLTAARIHYERQRYQEALDRLVEYLKITSAPRAEDYVFFDHLRQLGAVPEF